MKEIWKDIPNYEGLYQASNLGNIKRTYKNGKQKILKPVKDAKGYLRVNLSKNNAIKNVQIHRLIAKTFIGESNLTVNHKDKDRKNNKIGNLEYMTLLENIQYSNCKTILQFDKENNFIRKWNSIAKIEEALKINNGNISKCCKGIRKTAGGYVWRYYYGG